MENLHLILLAGLIFNSVAQNIYLDLNLCNYEMHKDYPFIYKELSYFSVTCTSKVIELLLK